MRDLFIIKEIEKLLEIELINGFTNTSRDKGYTLDSNESVITLYLNDCRIENLWQIMPYLLELNGLKILSLSHNLINDISPLTDLNQLGALSIMNNNIVSASSLGRLNQLKLLNVSNNKIGDIYPFHNLTNLEFLYIDNNNIYDIDPLSELIDLKVLHLDNNKFDNISILSNLTNLDYLSLDSNNLENLLPIKNLHKLTQLNLNKNNIHNLEVLGDLNHLNSLKLNDNNIENISIISKMENLTDLALDNNKISDISAIAKNKKLVNFVIRGNKIIDISPLKNLLSLKKLWISRNKVSDISPLERLVNLESLELGENSISNIRALSKLKKLEYLDCTKNEINSISTISTLSKLTEAHFSNNKIKDVSPILKAKSLKKISLNNNEIAQISQEVINKNWEIIIDKEYYNTESGELVVKGNPLVSPPIEIINKGKEAINRYYEKINHEGIDYIYEAKLTLVGEGSAGKTSLQRRLLNQKSALPKKDKRTRGIEIKDWVIKKENGKNHIVHIWDFGGQDVYYPVHRFFITENSVFVLLASTRQTHHNFDYWIPTIYQFGGKSPIILGQTCHEGNKIPWNDLGVYVVNSNFNIIKTQSVPYYELNLLNKNEGLSTIKQIIINQILNLPRYGRRVPKSWIPVRNILNTESKANALISFERFKIICNELNAESFSKLTDITDCCQFLHDIGVVLWYSSIPDLKNWVILQPEWAMNAVYKIIDDEIIQKQKGHILSKDFDRLWQDWAYEQSHPILKEMLEVFKIAFPKKHKTDEYIIPARLLSMPPKNEWSEDKPYLRLEYKYEFMPRGIVNQLSAELSRYIVNEEEVWNNAVNFSYENNLVQCQVKEDFHNRKISIKSYGNDARGIMILVKDALINITESYKGVKPEIYVPCTCLKCLINNKPTLFLYDDLLRWYAEERESGDDPIVFCNEGRRRLTIDELLYNVGLPNNQKSKNNMKKITIFLASSFELKEDREQFEIFINRENKRLHDENIFLRLELWEDFIDAMSKSRLQEEYNKVVKESDIFISLFYTKVGKFTAEEFEVAFKEFNESGKPFVYTYFKESSINISQINQDDINTRFDFQKKLKSLGHFPTTYSSIDDLKYKFKVQLEKILPRL